MVLLLWDLFFWHSELSLGEAYKKNTQSIIELLLIKYKETQMK